MQRRTIRTAFAAAAALAVSGGAALAQSASCQGDDLIAKMQREEPARYRAVLDNFATLENGEGIFWKIEKPGIKPSYLVGTAHVTDQRVLDLLLAVEPKLKQARALIVEIANISPDISRQIAIVQQYGMLPEGETLDSRLTEDEQKMMAEATAAHGMPWFSARRMKASFLALTMSVPPCAKIAIMRGEKVFDARLIEYAKENDVPVIGLETIDEQLSLVSQLDEATQLAGLMEAVQAGNRLAEDMYETTIVLYQTRRIAMLLSLMEELKRDYPASSKAMDNFEQPIVIDRNLRMHERALNEFNTGNVVMAVGALHLPGETGLVKLFWQSGFSVTRVDGN